MSYLKIVSAAIMMLLLAAVSSYAGGFGIQMDFNNFESDTEDNGFSVDDEETDFGLGARVLFGGNTHFIGSFDYYFIGGDVFDLFDIQFYEINGNIAYAFPTAVVRPYVGGGLGLARISFDGELLDDSTSELGVNILGGVRFEIPIISPFFELRYTWYSEDETFNNRFVVTAGILF